MGFCPHHFKPWILGSSPWGPAGAALICASMDNLHRFVFAYLWSTLQHAKTHLLFRDLRRIIIRQEMTEISSADQWKWCKLRHKRNEGFHENAQKEQETQTERLHHSLTNHLWPGQGLSSINCLGEFEQEFFVCLTAQKMLLPSNEKETENTGLLIIRWW